MSALILPATQVPPRLILGRGTVFFVLWVVLLGHAPSGLAVGLIAAAAATWTSLHLWPSSALLSPLGVARFALRFLPQSLRAGVGVARHAFAPKVALQPGIASYRTTLPPGMSRSALCAVMSLQPGTLPVAAENDGTLRIHCLEIGRPVAEQLAADEAAFLGTLSGERRHV
ncbi:MAG: na+/H+ ion antiporter subunit [Hyphomicrobiales bacterium]|jgi:multicomponent Na+:H+ antiporter subunit E|nr:na+/H+ ion antiporter subunit [Hyphomicrobiales bacterium]